MRIRRVKRVGLIALLTIGLAIPTACQLGGAAQGDAVRAAKPPAPIQLIIHPLLVKYTSDFLANNRLRRVQVEGRDLEQMRQDYQQIVTAKLAENFVIASKPGPQVLRLDAVLINHELDKRNWLAVDLAFRGVPKVQLVVYLRNSVTGKVFDVVGINLGPTGNRLMKDTPGFYWHFMRLVFDRVGTRLQRSLEAGGSEEFASQHATTPSRALARK